MCSCNSVHCGLSLSGEKCEIRGESLRTENIVVHRWKWGLISGQNQCLHCYCGLGKCDICTLADVNEDVCVACVKGVKASVD